MSRIKFENSPSIKTPINAENLNKLNNVVISPTEPTTGEEVWIKSGGKNLFNKNKATLRYLALKDSGTLTYADKMAVSDYIIIEKLESIILSGMTNELSNGGAFYDSSKTYISGFTLNEILAGVSVPSNAKYVRVNTSIEELDITQLEEGLIVTEFEPYVDKEIYVKNDNGVYEEFINVEEANFDNYSTAEQRIGTWIDGKPLYRKVVNCGPLPNATSKTIAHGIANVDKFISIKGCATATTDNYAITIPNVSPSVLASNVSINANATNIFIGAGANRSEYTYAYAILEYTKK